MVEPRGFNALLAGLPAGELARIEPLLEEVSFAHGDPIARPGQPMAYAYFPTKGMASVVAVMEQGLGAEVAAIGSEGMVGLPIFLRASSMPFAMMWQLDGRAYRISAADLIIAAVPGTRLATQLLTYSQALYTQTAQSAACNLMHSVSKRGARWLLATQDRAGGDEFFITHEFLAFMLGVARQSVSIAVGALQEAGTIRYRRGNMQILDRLRLETASCECYGIVRRESERLLGIARAEAAVMPVAGSRGHTRGERHGPQS